MWAWGGSSDGGGMGGIVPQPPRIAGVDVVRAVSGTLTTGRRRAFGGPSDDGDRVVRAGCAGARLARLGRAGRAPAPGLRRPERPAAVRAADPAPGRGPPDP